VDDHASDGESQQERPRYGTERRVEIEHAPPPAKPPPHTNASARPPDEGSGESQHHERERRNSDNERAAIPGEQLTVQLPHSAEEPRLIVVGTKHASRVGIDECGGWLSVRERNGQRSRVPRIRR
jgi:hypothetical protein